VPRKIRELVRDLRDAGFYEISGAGKGSHRKFSHQRFSGAVTLSGAEGDDAKPYQEKQVRQAIEQVQHEDE
jgi:predicted RNA binding protein YcfA (HicA-like mRNA interferase family)